MRKLQYAFKRNLLIAILSTGVIYFFLLNQLFDKFIKKTNIIRFENISKKNFSLIEGEIQKIMIPFQILDTFTPDLFVEKEYQKLLEPFFLSSNSLHSLVWVPKSSKREYLKLIGKNYKISNNKKKWYYPVKYIAPNYIEDSYPLIDLSENALIESLLTNTSSKMFILTKGQILGNFTTYKKESIYILMPVFSKQFGLPRSERLKGILLGEIDMKHLTKNLIFAWDNMIIQVYTLSNKLIFSSDPTVIERPKYPLFQEEKLTIGEENFKIIFASTQIFSDKNIKLMHSFFLVLNVLIPFISTSILYLIYMNPSKKMLELINSKTSGLDCDHKKFQTIIQEAQIATLDWDIKKNKVFLSKNAKLIFPINEKNKFNVDSLYDFIHQDYLKDFKDKMYEILAGLATSFNLDLKIQPKNHSEYWVHLRGEVYEQWPDKMPRKILFIAHDISSSKNLQNEILIDPLTKLYNRRYLNSLLKNTYYSSEREKDIFTLAMFDIDHFKNINDTYGHQAGDFILKEFSKYLKENIRPNDILARYGGEEFVVVFKMVDRFEAATIVERIKNNVQDMSFEYDSKKIRLTFSCGLADLSEIKKNNVYSEILKISDLRLYKAKNNGRNLVIEN